jgi:hypothetical protein
LELDWNWIGIGLELDWNWIGIGLELDWNWIGIGLELDWNWIGLELDQFGMKFIIIVHFALFLSYTKIITGGMQCILCTLCLFLNVYHFYISNIMTINLYSG